MKKVNNLFNITQSICDKAGTQAQCSLYYPLFLGPPKSHQRLGQVHTICHLNTETHLGLQISHCRKYFSRSQGYLLISDLTLLHLQGQETLIAFIQQSTPKLCASHSQFTSINDDKFPENFKKW